MPEPIKPFYPIVDWLSDAVMGHMPQYLQDRDMFSNFGLGAIGMYAVVRGLQAVGRAKWLNKAIPGFNDRWLPRLEKFGIICMTAAPAAFAFFDPDGAKEIMTQHPTYTSGMSGAYLGSVAGAAQDLYDRSRRSKL